MQGQSLNYVISPAMTRIDLSSDPQANPRVRYLFIVLSCFFVANALMAEFLGSKLFSVEATLGIPKADWKILGMSLSFDMTAGVLLWPVVFVMTDIINEYFGGKGIRTLSYLTAGLIAYAFVMTYLAMRTQPSDFWMISEVQGRDGTKAILDNDRAYNSVFGQSIWIIIGSLVAFLIGQLVDVFVFHRLKRLTGEKAIWLRSTGSTIVSQLIDSFVVLFIAFYLSGRFTFKQVLAIAIVNYLYKFVMAVIMTPVIYGVHYGIDKYLGEETARKLTLSAATLKKYE